MRMIPRENIRLIGTAANPFTKIPEKNSSLNRHRQAETQPAGISSSPAARDLAGGIRSSWSENQRQNRYPIMK